MYESESQSMIWFCALACQQGVTGGLVELTDGGTLYSLAVGPRAMRDSSAAAGVFGAAGALPAFFAEVVAGLVFGVDFDGGPVRPVPRSTLFSLATPFPPFGFVLVAGVLCNVGWVGRPSRIVQHGHRRAIRSTQAVIRG